MKKRKLSTLLLVAALTIGLFATFVTAGGYGGTMDLDGDNRITIHDVQLAKESEDGIRKLSASQIFAKSDYRSSEIVKKLFGNKEEKRMNILLIGNSFSCGFPEELSGMLGAAGIKARIYSVYFPACTTQQHWEWTEADEAHYRLRHYLQTGGYVTDGYESKVDGVSTILDPVDLDYCLAAEEKWDVIALQNHFTPGAAQSVDSALKQTEPYATNMYSYLKEKCPEAKLVWFETWMFEIGYPYSNILNTLDDQNKYQDNIRTASTTIATKNGISMIPCGGAWRIARNEHDLGLLTRVNADGTTDYVHDDTKAGTQYLNACVWYECLTGKSCLENTYRPADYTLDETRAQVMQQIAHKAVEQNPVKTPLLYE